jgi:hypothetical protein
MAKLVIGIALLGITGCVHTTDADQRMIAVLADSLIGNATRGWCTRAPPYATLDSIALTTCWWEESQRLVAITTNGAGRTTRVVLIERRHADSVSEAFARLANAASSYFGKARISCTSQSGRFASWASNATTVELAAGVADSTVQLTVFAGENQASRTACE